MKKFKANIELANIIETSNSDLLKIKTVVNDLLNIYFCYELKDDFFLTYYYNSAKTRTYILLDYIIKLQMIFDKLSDNIEILKHEDMTENKKELESVNPQANR